MIHLNALKTFLDVAKTGSFRIAGERNFLTQPAVSQQIRQLEEKLGTSLFERQGRKVELTSSGKIFLSYAENALKQLEEVKSRFNECDAGVPCVLRIATIYSIGLHELKPIVKRYLQEFPNVELHLEYHPFNKIYEMVFNRAIDFGLVAYPIKRFGMMTETFAEDDMALVQSGHHPVLKKAIHMLADLNSVKFVTFALGLPTRDAIDHYLRENGAYPYLTGEYDNIETLKSAVDLGIGCSILPKNTIQQELKDHTFKIIPIKIHLKRPLGILYPKGKVFTKCTQTFYEMVMRKFR